MINVHEYVCNIHARVCVVCIEYFVCVMASNQTKPESITLQEKEEEEKIDLKSN